MYKEINAQLTEAKGQLDRLGQLRASLAPARERLTAEAHRVHQVENCLAAVESQIQSLESFTLESLIDSLLWRKQGKLNGLREELSKLQPEHATGEQTLLELVAAVKGIEENIAELGNAEETYKSLCDQKLEAILSEEGETAAELKELSARLNVVKNERQALRKCLQIGKSLIERIQTKTKAVGRAANKMMHGGPLGALGSAAVNALHHKTVEPIIRRAREGLEEFARCLGSLEIDAKSERDGELVRLGALLGESTGELDTESGASPLFDLIHQAIGLVQSKLDEVEPTIAALEAQRIEHIENA